MATPQAVIYARAGDRVFTEKAREHARAYHPDLHVVERNPRWWNDSTACVPDAAVVYVEERFGAIAEAYRAVPVPIFTEADLEPPAPHVEAPRVAEPVLEPEPVATAQAPIEAPPIYRQPEPPAPEVTRHGGDAGGGRRKRSRGR